MRGWISERSAFVSPLFDSEKGKLGSGIGEYPLHRKRDDPDFATQSHADHMSALVEATHKALAEAGVPGKAVRSIALDTTGSSVIPVGDDLEPLDDYYLWCDHRAWREAQEITEKAHESGLLAINGAAAFTLRNGVFQSCCTGCGTIPIKEAAS